MAARRRRDYVLAATLALILLALAAIFVATWDFSPEQKAGTPETSRAARNQGERHRPNQPVPAPPSGVPPLPVNQPSVNTSPAQPGTDTPPEGMTIELAGRTAFQRRLAMGEALEVVMGELEAGAIELPQALGAFAALRDHVLRIDAVSAYDWSDDNALERVRVLMTPARKRDAFALIASRASDDKLGSDRLVRLWLRKGDDSGAFDETLALNAEGTLWHIIRTLGRDEKKGFDLLVSTRLGTDTFPEFKAPDWAAGLYLDRDDFCLVRSGLPAAMALEVVKHESIHALTFRLSPDYESSRFVSEGLAEYLRLLRNGDSGLDAPDERLAANLAALDLLLSRIEGRGADFTEFRPAALVELGASQFYDLRQLSYLMAQAAMAYIDPGVIEAALRGGTDRGIVEAVKTVEWRPFREWIARVGASGRASDAIVVYDGVLADPLVELSASPWNAGPREALERIGIRLSERAGASSGFLDSDLLERRSDDQVPGSGAYLSAIVKLPAGDPIVFAAETTLAMAADIEAKVPRASSLDWDASWQGQLLNSRTRAEFVERMRASLTNEHGAPPIFAGVAEETAEIRGLFSMSGDTVDLGKLAVWLKEQGHERRPLILCLALRDMIARGAIADASRGLRNPEDIPEAMMAERYAQILKEAGFLPRALVVIDLAGGASDGAAFVAAARQCGVEHAVLWRAAAALK